MARNVSGEFAHLDSDLDESSVGGISFVDSFVQYVQAAFNRVFDVFFNFLERFSLTDTTRDRRTFGNVPVFFFRYNDIQPHSHASLLGKSIRISTITLSGKKVKLGNTILSNCAIDVLHEMGRADAARELLRRLREIDGAIREIGGGLAEGGTGRMIFRMDYVLAILEEILAPPDFARIYIKIDPASNTHHATLDPTGALPLKDIRKYIPNLLKAYLGAQKPTVYLIMGRHGSYYDKYWSLQQMIKIMREDRPSVCHLEGKQQAVFNVDA